MMVHNIRVLLSSWKKDEDALAAVEAAMIFPIMLTMLLGVYDLGFGILANQKAIRASQVVADLITRENIVSDTDIAEAIEAGRLAFMPMDSTSYGVDVVSIRFDENADAEILWRETVNMPSLPDALTAVDALSDADEGVVMVSVHYVYEPLFAGFIVNDMNMNEVAFGRGRSSPIISHE